MLGGPWRALDYQVGYPRLADGCSHILRCLRATIVGAWPDLVSDNRVPVADYMTLSKDANERVRVPSAMSV